MGKDLTREEIEKIANSAEPIDLSTIPLDGNVDMDRFWASVARIALGWD